MDAGIRQSWDNIVDILSRPQVWQLRHLSLIPGRGRDFSLLQSAHTSSGSHPTSCSEDMGVAWYEADHSCPFTVVLRLCVCVWSWTSTTLNACMAHTGTTLQIPDCTEYIELEFLSEELLLHTYCWVQLASVISGQKWVFFLPWIGGLVAASFCGFVRTPAAFSATQFEAVWMM